MSDSPQILRPTPRRPFELPSADSSAPSTPSGEQQVTEGIDLLDPKNSELANKRSGSLLNLTSSTLLGIFQSTAFEDSREDDSPWDTQTLIPVEPRSDLQNGRRFSIDGQAAVRRHSPRTGSAYYVPLVLKTSLLFICGVTYGTIIAHLHENNWIAPVKLEYIDRNSYVYLLAWGIAGVAFAFVLPWLDKLGDNDTADQNKDVENKQSTVTLAIRSIGAFVGIAFAMRRLPWESATQESVTLALVNPLLWYLIDRTRTGFWLSTVVAIVGMGITLGLHPELIPSSSSTVGLGLRNWRLEYDIEGGISQDATAVAVWLASVFYSACVCFGNIGRQLTLDGGNVQHAHIEKKR
ncbi:hypothetical protein TMatcc_001668 [Talaromyces marneffei ATCC 18224]|uniref:INSIG domain protein n=1 Tax=Talaromyces marneffei (strain ATCC 18224 / CBS 334.59 / QM 7333) TaxID=441960 RepID=B6QHG7_TALMQ|nr:uncharacterized protein EYB26_007125 [Talaromyces marneffei]EEA22812.1 conserved hypothetical protein [Talaromyces marneffei ATCC 18224]KAE8551692.1 hypothetical protein EYB25_005582 [Talaromyces marneffei]QGA19436.1 hypothetical protein EYB26_007125 [Talaromyces marneffei]